MCNCYVTVVHNRVTHAYIMHLKDVHSAINLQKGDCVNFAISLITNEYIRRCLLNTFSTMLSVILVCMI